MLAATADDRRCLCLDNLRRCTLVGFYADNEACAVLRGVRKPRAYSGIPSCFVKNVGIPNFF